MLYLKMLHAAKKDAHNDLISVPLSGVPHEIHRAHKTNKNIPKLEYSIHTIATTIKYHQNYCTFMLPTNKQIGYFIAKCAPKTVFPFHFQDPCVDSASHPKRLGGKGGRVEEDKVSDPRGMVDAVGGGSGA